MRGRYNKKKSNLADSVGNGTRDKPSNAYELDWSGNAYFAGNVSSSKEPREYNHLINLNYLESVLNGRPLVSFKSAKLSPGDRFIIPEGMMFYFKSGDSSVAATITGKREDEGATSFDVTGVCVGFSTEVGNNENNANDGQYRLSLLYNANFLLTSVESENMLISGDRRMTIIAKKDLYIWYIVKGDNDIIEKNDEYLGSLNV